VLVAIYTSINGVEWSGVAAIAAAGHLPKGDGLVAKGKGKDVLAPSGEQHVSTGGTWIDDLVCVDRVPHRRPQHRC
jgi:hypothetical protein